MPTETPLKNIAETVRDAMLEFMPHGTISPDDGQPLSRAHLVDLPQGRQIHDLTDHHRRALEYLKPARRKGTARLADLQSLIGWAARFAGPTSALFAAPVMTAPKLTCIADYHAPGPIDPEAALGDPTARHCHHRATYDFPLSDEWKAWSAIDGKPLEKDDLGEFIEAQAKDIMDPTPAILRGAESEKNADWENRLIATAQRIEGRFGQLSQLLAMSKRFQVYEQSDLTVKTNRDTGEAEIQFLNEHKGADGKPLNVPNLIIITIPVFEGGAPYRMAVRFRYRKSGGSVRFILSIYNPERVFRDAFDKATAEAAEKTGLPLFFRRARGVTLLSAPARRGQRRTPPSPRGKP